MTESRTTSPEPHSSGRSGDRWIGAILVEGGQLRLEDVEPILRLQRERNLRFGDAAVQLGYVSQADVDFALAHQFGYPCLPRGESSVSEALVAAYSASGPQVEALRTLRSQLMLRWFDRDTSRKALAVVSANRGEGRSFIAASLAVVFSQLGERTLLIDTDMRHPGQHELFGLENRIGLSTVLSGRAGAEAIQRVPALRDLSVLPAGAAPPNSSELLSRPEFARFLSELAVSFDVILLDSSPASESTEPQRVAQRAGAGLVVVRQNVTRMAQVKAVCDSLSHANAEVVGTVLNDF